MKVILYWFVLSIPTAVIVGRILAGAAEVTSALEQLPAEGLTRV